MMFPDRLLGDPRSRRRQRCSVRLCGRTPSEFAEANLELVPVAAEALATLSLHSVVGLSWTTDAPFCETAEAIEAARVKGILAVEMEAAALYVIADDVEDLDWVRTQENRDKSDRWMRGNVLPSIDEHDGRMVIIGNWLHTDGLMARLKNTGIFKVLEFSLLRDGDGTEVERCTWNCCPVPGSKSPVSA
jgi:hypothetical protein